MNCKRCLSVEAQYRVYTDLISVKVCTSCAIKALELGIVVEALFTPITRPLVSQHPEEGQDSDVLGKDLLH